jgi:hypothetical protein
VGSDAGRGCSAALKETRLSANGCEGAREGIVFLCSCLERVVEGKGKEREAMKKWK